MFEEGNLYHAFGGMDGCRKLSEAFYAHVARDPVLQPLFSSSFRCAIESFTWFLAQFLGGPCEYSGQRWPVSLGEAHARFKIGPKEREAWLKNMEKALAEMPVEESARGALQGFFQESSAYLVNRPKPLAARSILPGGPATSRFHEEIAKHWEVQRTLEDAVAAVRLGNAPRAIALAGSSLAQSYFHRNRASFLSLLAVMCGSRDSALVDYVRQQLVSDPRLTTERYASGRTLLHATAEAGNPVLVEMLLDLGADPNTMDKGGHTPLYCLGNACTGDSAPGVVHALVRSGANVNAQDNLKRCTALHMAARRGNVPAAEALLECGADIEIRDSLGDTPLRRAVNCAKLELARLLLSRGADIHSQGSKRLTVLQAARGAAMKELLSTPQSQRH